MTHKLALVQKTLSDGSIVWDVSFNETLINCPTERDAVALIEQISVALRDHTIDEHRISWKGSTMTTQIDVQFSNHGSIWLAEPLTDAARDWIADNIDDDAQWFGGALAVEPRFGEEIVAGMIADGLSVAG